ncbi:MAG: hypothetical protein IJO31_06095 [Oscillospiraceae bacterium]|nr:hypothetical protein [Oscillospiraceae bacterium]
MAKLKGFIAVVLALALIVAGAYFPKAISTILDWQNRGNVSTNPISSIRIEMAKDIPSLGKLALLSRLESTIEIPESKAKMNKEEVMEAVYTGIHPYVDSQLMAYCEQSVQMHPCLIQAKDDQDMQSIVWFVEIIGDPVNYTFLQLIIDDETGNILMISFTHENLQGLLFGIEALTVFADIFFNGLGIDDYASYLTPDLKYAYVGDNANAIRYQLGNSVYGEVIVDLYVHEHGFYIEFPSK